MYLHMGSYAHTYKYMGLLHSSRLRLVTAGREHVLLMSLTMALISSGVPVSRESEPTCTTPGPWNWNPAIIRFNIYTCVLSALTCRNVCCEKGILFIFFFSFPCRLPTTPNHLMSSLKTLCASHHLPPDWLLMFV